MPQTTPSPDSSPPSPGTSPSNEVIDAEWTEVAPAPPAPSASARPPAPLILRPRPVRPAASVRGRGRSKVLCSTCHQEVTSFVTAKVGPISLPLCRRCANAAEFGVKVLHYLFR